MYGCHELSPIDLYYEKFASAMPWLIISANNLFALIATQYRDLLSFNVIAFLRLALAYVLEV